MSHIAPSDSAPAFQASVISLFPDMFPGPLGHSLAGRALQDNIWSLDVITPRSFAVGKHNDVDDPPFGGGHGMVMRPDVMSAALNSLEETPGPRIYLSPRGKKLTQSMVRDFSQEPGLVMVCGRYEGLDQRAIDKHNLLEVSVGDYILSGGELAALVLLDSIVRLLPGVMGKEIGHYDESFENGLLEYPHYTQPRYFDGIEPPDVLLSGHHANIKAWRMAQSEAITRARRPDLWARYTDNNKAADTQDDVVSDASGQKDQSTGKKLS
ncbi:MAG: tRNA (guanosine(37)-N1)-methyltransferase TrmD [Alphaproteobacteria bacterium]|jgi:tRNA (guanine37-N1)-methyltransferase|nr:tRNA (guanosine(37)-N1)-methyltransferase TrmD [Alphaproteobacteria bacterium]